MPALLRFFKRSEASIIIGCVLVFVVFSVVDRDGWFKFFTIRNITRYTAILGIMAIGETLVILSKEIDLSVGSVYGIVGVAFISLEPDHGVVLSFGAALCIAAAIGLLNALLVLKGHLSSMIVTLGGLFAYRGVIYVITEGTVGTLSRQARAHPLIHLFGANRFWGLENGFWWFLGVVIVFTYILQQTPYGNQLLAIGGDRVSAASRGIRVRLVKALAFMTCSMLAGFAAIITLCDNPRTHVTIGQDLELQAIAASVIGGVLITGGRGAIVGAALGTYFLTAVRSELITLGAPPNWYITFVGFVLVFAVVVNTSIQRRLASGSAQ
jgi:simple sugar transport system permease protein/ribose transport system permease protein